MLPCQRYSTSPIAVFALVGLAFSGWLLIFQMKQTSCEDSYVTAAATTVPRNTIAASSSSPWPSAHPESPLGLFGFQPIPVPRMPRNAESIEASQLVTEAQWQLAQGVFLRYSAWHTANRGKKNSKYITWACVGNRDFCGGFSDRTRGMTTILLSAMFTKRVMLVHYTNPPGIAALTPPQAIDWRIEGTPYNPKRLNRRSSYDRKPFTESDMVHLMSDDRLSTWRCNLVPTLDAGVRFWNFTTNATFVAKAPARFRDSPPIFQSREEVEAVYSLPLGILQAMTYRYLFKQHDTAVASIVSGLRQRIQDWGKPFIGLHIRNGDKAMKAAPENRELPTLPDLTELLKAAERCSGLSVFISSDDPLMVAMIQMALPSSVLALTCCGRAIHVGSMKVADMAVREHGNASRISYNAQNAMKEIFTAYELLSRADALVSLGRGHVGSFLKAAAYWELKQQVPLYKSLHAAKPFLRQLC